MAKRKARWTFVLACLAGSCHLVSAQGGYEQFNAAVHRELRALDPMAEVIFQQADDTRSRGDHRAAADLYKLVLERVPNFAHAMRREAMEEVALGNRRTAHREVRGKLADGHWSGGQARQDRAPRRIAQGIELAFVVSSHLR